MHHAWSADDRWRRSTATATHFPGRSQSPAPATSCLSRAAESAERRVSHGRLVVVRKSQLDQAVEVFEHLRISLDRGLPVLVNAALEVDLCGRYLVRMRRCVVVVEGVCREPVQMGRVCCLAPLGQKAEVFQDVILCMSSDPRSGKLLHQYKRQDSYGEFMLFINDLCT
jgi:hypothetical protein